MAKDDKARFDKAVLQGLENFVFKMRLLSDNVRKFDRSRIFDFGRVVDKSGILMNRLFTAQKCRMQNVKGKMDIRAVPRIFFIFIGLLTVLPRFEIPFLVRRHYKSV